MHPPGPGSRFLLGPRAGSGPGFLPEQQVYGSGLPRGCGPDRSWRVDGDRRRAVCARSPPGGRAGAGGQDLGPGVLRGCPVPAPPWAGPWTAAVNVAHLLQGPASLPA